LKSLTDRFLQVIKGIKMPLMIISPSVIDSLLVFSIAYFIDAIFGEPPDRLHPTVWMGTVIAYLEQKIKSENPIIERAGGVLLGLLVIMLFTVPIHFALSIIHNFIGRVVYIIASAMLFKITFAIKCMKQYTAPIAEALKRGDEAEARKILPFIVRRDPSKLDRQHIISAAVESIAEGTVDGITSPFLYFAIFGVEGSIAFRAINTLDSMVGYKDKRHIYIGWFSARMDTVANYITARLTAILMILAAFLLHEDWRGAWKILWRDRKNTESLNAGWPMSAMAGALNVQLEKPGFYILGDAEESLSPEHIMRALRVMELTVILFSILIVFPILMVKTLFLRC